MPERITVTFRVRDKGGPSGGKTLSHGMPAFALDDFLRAPNAEEFIKKAYFAAAKKLVRDIEERKNGTVASDLDSHEAVIARSLSFTKDDIKDWVRTRDWSRAQGVKNIEGLIPQIEKLLPDLANRRNHFTPEVAAKLADKVVAAVADYEDPVAEFLFTTLTTVRSSPTDELLPF